MTRSLAILVVDDDQDALDVMVIALASRGFTVSGASEGQAALEELQRRPYDLIVTDLRMPVLDGSALYDRVTWEHPNLRQRFVCVSGDTSGPAQTFFEATGAPVLRKPFDIATLQRVVEAMLDVETAPA